LHAVPVNPFITCLQNPPKETAERLWRRVERQLPGWVRRRLPRGPSRDVSAAATAGADEQARPGSP